MVFRRFILSPLWIERGFYIESGGLSGGNGTICIYKREGKLFLCYLLHLFLSQRISDIVVHGRDILRGWVSAILVFCGWSTCRDGRSFGVFLVIVIHTKWGGNDGWGLDIESGCCSTHICTKHFIESPILHNYRMGPFSYDIGTQHLGVM